MSKARRGAALPVFAPLPVAQEDVITAAPVKSLDRDAYVAEVRMRTAPRMQRYTSLSAHPGALVRGVQMQKKIADRRAERGYGGQDTSSEASSETSAATVRRTSPAVSSRCKL